MTNVKPNVYIMVEANVAIRCHFIGVTLLKLLKAAYRVIMANSRRVLHRLILVH